MLGDAGHRFVRFLPCFLLPSLPPGCGGRIIVRLVSPPCSFRTHVGSGFDSLLRGNEKHGFFFFTLNYLLSFCVHFTCFGIRRDGGIGVKKIAPISDENVFWRVRFSKFSEFYSQTHCFNKNYTCLLLNSRIYHKTSGGKKSSFTSLIFWYFLRVRPPLLDSDD